jgi:ABC-type transport system involved in multi-copper enzyme maturation permease subunit
VIYRNYLLNLLRSHRVLLSVGFAFLCLFQVLILTLIEQVDLFGLFQELLQRLPPPAQQLFGEEYLAQFSVSGALAFGYNHPLVLVTLSLVAILLPSRHIAGEIEDGTLELLFALPVRRQRIAISLWVGSSLILLLLLVGCVAGTVIGFLIHSDMQLRETAALARVGVNLWLLLVAITSYTMLSSAFAREGGKASLRAAGLTLGLYFLHFAVRIWPAIEFLRPFTIFNYYQPQQLMTDSTLFGRNIAVLSTVILATGIAAVVRIARRDIPG